MEQMFGLRDVSAPHRISRREPRRRGRSALLAAMLALFAGVILAGAAYGGGSASGQRVTVHAGQTLWSIAESHYPGGDIQGRVAQIEAVNHLSGAALSPGEILILPAA